MSSSLVDRIAVGVDVGSISVKLAVLGRGTARKKIEEAGLGPKGYRLVDREGALVALSSYERHLGRPRAVAVEMLRDLFQGLPQEAVHVLTVTGSGGKHLAEVLRTKHENEFRAVAQGVRYLHPETRTILEMGGENSKYILLAPAGDGNSVGIVDYETNGDCAAGTGSFMDQQASRLLFKIEDVGAITAAAVRTPTIAGRCSVFAKSDMIHAQQKGYAPGEVLRGLCEAVARNYKASITKGKKIEPPVAFIGGVSANSGVAGAMGSLFDLDDNQFFVPEAHAWMAAIGAALLGAAVHEEPAPFRSLADVSRDEGEGAESFPRSDRLSMEDVVLLRDRVKPYTFPEDGRRVDAFLGVDIGSVSTNLVVTDSDANVIYEIYVRTEARPIEVVHRGLQEIEAAIGDRIRILGVGTTGSGRELIGELIGADTINDEITAHKTGATYIGRKLIDREVDTIFEIGGQDSKFISIQDGVVVDFAMNEACAAGTGSFLEEQAERLGISIKGEFSDLALSSKRPIRLGERCTVFIEKDIIPYLQKGAKVEDLVAGLAYSIALNYLNRVVRGRSIGDVIYFQGGTAYNDSVGAAFATILGKKIIIPPHNGVVGAIGMAILAREKIVGGHGATGFRGYSLDAVDYEIRDFTCKACTNYCDIQEFKVEGEKTYWGDKCSERFRKRPKVDREAVIPDLLKFREEAIFEGFDPDREGVPVVGMPRAMYFYERFPFWNRFFTEMDCKVVVSDPTTNRIVNRGLETTVAEPCFPIKVAHGHVANLLDKEIDVLFIPNVVNAETDTPEMESHLCPWGQTLPFVIGQSGMKERIGGRLMQPNIHFRRGIESVKKELREVWKTLGVSRRDGERALKAAYDAQADFGRKLVAKGREAMETLGDEPAIVLLGRPYNIHDRGVNLNVPTKLRDYYGVNVIPLDFLPLYGTDIRDVNRNMYWNYGRKILQAARIVSKHRNLHIIYITNFKCGPDSYIKHYIDEASGKPFLSLTIDGHSNDAGILTRCEAYLDSKGFLRRWTDPVAVGG
ncbi:MAG: acyl-CoA dehydratase activase [Candidatus Eisenbacteria bacterium]